MHQDAQELIGYMYIYIAIDGQTPVCIKGHIYIILPILLGENTSLLVYIIYESDTKIMSLARGHVHRGKCPSCLKSGKKEKHVPIWQDGYE